METSAAKIVRRLRDEGWTLMRHGAKHDVYEHPGKPLTIQVPRHRTLTPGVARSIAKAAGWE
jgi:predicted RNA binding protein YcfA (HicA-like mRNA interferase family)